MRYGRHRVWAGDRRYGLDRGWENDRVDLDRVRLPEELRPFLDYYDITAEELMRLRVPTWGGVPDYALALWRTAVPRRPHTDPGPMLHVVDPLLYQQLYEEEMTRLALETVPPPYDSLWEFSQEDPIGYEKHLWRCKEEAYFRFHEPDEPVTDWQPDYSSFSYRWN